MQPDLPKSILPIISKSSHFSTLFHDGLTVPVFHESTTEVLVGLVHAANLVSNLQLLKFHLFTFLAAEFNQFATFLIQLINRINSVSLQIH